MFWNKKPDQTPSAIMLSELESAASGSGLKTKRTGNVLYADNGHLITRVEISNPETKEIAGANICAVIRLTTETPDFLNRFIESNQGVFNSFASMGSLILEKSNKYIGSRLTVYEGEGAWENLQLPLLLCATLVSSESMLGAVRLTLAGEPTRCENSKWNDGDLDEAHYYLSRIGHCNFDAKRLTAEFGLKDGQVSAVLGSNKTALFQLMLDQPHPELGGGLFCLLQMPHQINDAGRLLKVCNQLNQMEMAALDLPPHFGAWCPSKMSNCPAYVIFLPNVLHTVKGLASNFGVWSFHRAQWANAMLASLGFSIESSDTD